VNENTLAKDRLVRCVTCRVGARVIALPIEHVVETMRPLPAEPIAGMPPFVTGVAVVRGVATPVIDAARMTGTVSSVPVGRFVAVRVGERRAVVAVDAVLGIQALPIDSFERLLSQAGAAGSGAIEGIGSLDSELLLVLRCAKIVPAAVWDAIDGAEGRS
jgi:purine-binding chemotaxis protein CheW